MSDLSPLVGLSGVAVVAALVQVCKPLIRDQRFWPVLAVGLGVVWNVGLALALSPPLPLGPAILLGVLSGLAASGAYSGGRALVGR